MHLNSRLLFERYARSYIRPASRVLELGPDQQPSTYQSLCDAMEWYTADLAADPRGVAHLQMKAAYGIPSPDDSFDVVLSGQVIEHVGRVWEWMRELARVCRPGGYVITINPVSWPYHTAGHYLDCWRIYPEGMRALSEDAGLEVVLSIAESLEPAVSRRTYYGDTHVATSSWREYVKRLIGWPLPVALDTITIARKP